MKQSLEDSFETKAKHISSHKHRSNSVASNQQMYTSFQKEVSRPNMGGNVSRNANVSTT